MYTLTRKVLETTVRRKFVRKGEFEFIFRKLWWMEAAQNLHLDPRKI